MMQLITKSDITKNELYFRNQRLFSIFLMIDFAHSIFDFRANLCAKATRPHKNRVCCDEARHGKAFEGLLNRYFK